MKKELRLDKILAHMGWGTRTEIKKIARKGLVTVDGKAVKDTALKLDPQKAVIRVGGELVVYAEHVYLMLNKPAGYLSATADARDRTVLDLLSAEHRALLPFPVGRLDKDTEGLLLLTNDGLFSHKITAPKKKVPKAYYACIAGEVTPADVQSFLQGVVLEDGYQTMPAHLKILKAARHSEIELLICEGKYHQVKRMFQACGKEVTYLKRFKIGALMLDEKLRLGAYRALTEAELQLFS